MNKSGEFQEVSGMAKALRRVRDGLFAIALLCGMAVRGGKDLVAAVDVGITVPDTEGMTDEEVANAILRAAASSRWIITPLSDGLLNGVFEHRGHVVPVDITYGGRGCKIRYMGVDKDGVHPRVNKWMSDLGAEIRKELLQEVRA